MSITPSELAKYALAANCSIQRHKGSQFTFGCPEGHTLCSACGMWEILATGPKCLFWDRDLVPISLQFKATALLQSTHPELFI